MSDDRNPTDVAKIEQQIIEFYSRCDYSSGHDQTVVSYIRGSGKSRMMEKFIENIFFDEREVSYIGPKTQKALYDFLEKDRSDPMETPVSSPPKLTQAQRSKLNAKRKLNRQNRKRARK